MDALRAVLTPAAPVHGNEVVEWWAAGGARSREAGTPWEQALRGGALADRIGYAFAAGYEAALWRLVPDRDRARTAALCATERGPVHPRAIETALDGGALTGEKSFVTFGADADDLYVLARDAAHPGPEPRLVFVRVPRDAEGVAQTAMPRLAFAPEVPHASVRFTAVRAFAQLPGDGWADYVRPFRTIEDVHVHTGVLAFVVAQAARAGIERGITERGCAILVALAGLSAADPSAPATHVALAGVIADARRLLEDFEQGWAPAAPPDERARWERDRPLLRIAEKAREARLAKAWERLGSPAR